MPSDSATKDSYSKGSGPRASHVPSLRPLGAFFVGFALCVAPLSASAQQGAAGTGDTSQRGGKLTKAPRADQLQGGRSALPGIGEGLGPYGRGHAPARDLRSWRRDRGGGPRAGRPRVRQGRGRIGKALQVHPRGDRRQASAGQAHLPLRLHVPRGDCRARPAGELLGRGPRRELREEATAASRTSGSASRGPRKTRAGRRRKSRSPRPSPKKTATSSSRRSRRARTRSPCRARASPP